MFHGMLLTFTSLGKSKKKRNLSLCARSKSNLGDILFTLLRVLSVNTLSFKP